MQDTEDNANVPTYKIKIYLAKLFIIAYFVVRSIFLSRFFFLFFFFFASPCLCHIFFIFNNCPSSCHCISISSFLSCVACVVRVAHLSHINVCFFVMLFFSLWLSDGRWSSSIHTHFKLCTAFSVCQCELFPIFLRSLFFFRFATTKMILYLVFDAFANLNGIFEPNSKKIKSKIKTKQQRLR